MHDLLEHMCHTTARFRAAGADRLPQAERDSLVFQYFEILQQGFTAHRLLAPPDTPVSKKPGRCKQDDAKNLLDALLARAEQILTFLDNLAVPISPNQAERDLRMSHPCSKRFQEPFAVPRGPQLSESFAAIFQR